MVLAITIALALTYVASGTNFGFTLDTVNVVYSTGQPYLSMNIDSASLYNDHEGGRLNFSDPEFIKLGQQFCSASEGNAILRIGGSAADDLVFVSSESTENYTQNILVDSDYWDSLMDYIDTTHCKLVWDLNALSLRNDDNSC